MTIDLAGLAARAVLAPSIAVVAVFALRLLVRRAFGARIAYALWLVVPFATIAAFLPARRMAADAGWSATAAAAPAHHVAAPAVPLDVVQNLAAAFDPTPLIIAIWLTGFLASLAQLAFDQRRLLSGLARKEAHLVGNAVGPAVVGVVAPRIVIPSDFADRYSELERALVLEHERAHIRAGDVQVNALAAFLQCLFWFNPLIYLGRRALRVDQELACDERVMQRFGGARRVYAEAMLKAQLATRALPLGCAWPALGERPLKQRIAMLARPRIAPVQRAMGAVLCATLTLGLAATAWLAQPARAAYAADRSDRGWSGASGARLVEALMEGDVAEARRLIAAGADVDHWTPGDGTPLIMAARLDDRAEAFAVSQDLLRAGAHVDQRAPGEGNALIVASAHGDVELMRLFVEAGADVNAEVRGDETPLINAAWRGHAEAVRYLIDHGADVNLAVDAPTTFGHERRSPLSMALRAKRDDIVALLRAAGARD